MLNVQADLVECYSVYVYLHIIYFRLDAHNGEVCQTMAESNKDCLKRWYSTMDA